MKIINNLIWLSKRNLIIDLKFLSRATYIPFPERLEIVVKKYFTLIYHWFFKFNTGESNITINSKNIYYNTPYGLVGYEAMLAEQMYWVSLLHLSENAVFIDIGANVGSFTLGCNRLIPNSNSYCFEPVDSAFNALSKNSKGLNHVSLFNMALGNTNGKIYMNIDSMQTSFSKISTDNSGQEVEIRKLDDITQIYALHSIDLIKLDVEGFELNVLNGALNTLKKTKYLLMELNTSEYSLTDVVDIISKADKKLRLCYMRNFDLESDNKFVNGDVLFELI